MPVYNEAETISAAVERIRSLPLSLELVCVDDGSTDGTRELQAGDDTPYVDRLGHNHMDYGFGLLRADGSPRPAFEWLERRRYNAGRWAASPAGASSVAAPAAGTGSSPPRTERSAAGVVEQIVEVLGRLEGVLGRP